MNLIFKAVSDPSRRKILDLLKEQDRNAGDIAKNFDMSKPSISHHLDILKRADLITSTKKGQQVIYSINTSVIDELFAWIYQLKNELYEKNTQGSTILGDNYSSDNLPQ